jgi:Spy/CpxP family protein refolding chaperone
LDVDKGVRKENIGKENNMRKPALALIASVAFGLTSAVAVAQAQDAGPPPDAQHGQRHGGMRFDPQQRVNMLAKRLKLSDDQKQKLLPIFTDEQTQMKSLRDDSSLSREDKMTKMKSIHEDTETKVNGLLNDDQKQQYTKMQEQMRQRMHDRMGGGQGGPQGEAGGPPPPENQ